MKRNKRAERINFVYNTIKEVFEKGEDIRKEKLISMIMLKMFCSRRTALEYIQAGLSNYETKKEKVGDEMLIINLKGVKKDG